MHERTPRELKHLLEAEKTGQPFLALRDGEGTQVLVPLDESTPSLVIGRDPASDVCLHWDPLVSGLHARLECARGNWLLHDDGLSRNGSFVNDERLHGQRVLRDGDRLRFGATHALFRDPVPRVASTVVGGASGAALAISPAQKRVLVALCRPYKYRPPFASPATNEEIAGELVLSIDAVKSHLRALYQKCGLHRLPQNEKRVRLVEHALGTGLVSEFEL